MKDKLGQIEAYLKKFFEDNALKLLGSQDTETKLVSALVKAMQSQIRKSSSGILSAPNNFSLNVPAANVQDMRANQALINVLATNLYKATQEAGIHFEAHPTINIFPDETLKEGEFTVNAMWKETDLSETQAAEIDLELDLGANVPPKAFLIVGGSKIFTLERDVVNIGRKLDNHLVIDDPRVSRHHAQMRAIKGRYMLFDLDSSGGSYVNGEQMKQTILHPGDVISLAGVPMVFGQDAFQTISETQEYKPPASASDDLTTTSIPIKDIDLDTLD
jgi:hypothetical protein